MNNNPFITSGYIAEEYFCGREEETAQLLQDIQGKNNTVIISPRRMGKTGLIKHCFERPIIKENYYCFFIDIYSTLDLNDFVCLLGNKICQTIKQEKSLVETFIRIAKSIEFKLGVDEHGLFNASFGIKDVKDSQKTLDEIFMYLNQSKKPCVVAIDEFQQIENYPEKNIEALLRTYIQHCTNAMFIFAGSQRHIIQNMFVSSAKPFYHSSSILNLGPIPKEKYVEFVIDKFEKVHKTISAKQVEMVYDQFEGHTWYLQSLFYHIYYMSSPLCTDTIIKEAIFKKVNDNAEIYGSLLFTLSKIQQKLLKAIACEGKAEQIQSTKFINKYALTSASSVQSAMQKLLEKDLITTQQNAISINDKFFALWLENKFMNVE